MACITTQHHRATRHPPTWFAWGVKEGGLISLLVRVKDGCMEDSNLPKVFIIIALFFFLPMKVHEGRTSRNPPYFFHPIIPQI